CECGYTAGTEKNKMPVVLFLTTVYIPLWHRAVVCAVLQHRYTDSWCRYHPVPFPQYTSPAFLTFADFKKANKNLRT
ncbi:hypothetical protein J4W43_24490, partial [Escherichia coli]